jgi:N-acetylglucosaminyl-diphospho-decaprenol L-rhamnosyltransferase
VIYFLTVNYYSTELITKLLKSIEQTAQTPYKLVIVNNSAADLGVHSLQNEQTIVLEAKQNLGYGLACNIGLNWIYQTNPEAWVWVINPDTILLKDTLQKAQTFLEKHAELSIVGSVVYDSTGKVWFGGGRFIAQIGEITAENLVQKYPDKEYIYCDWISGCSLLLNLKNFSTCPQFSAAYFLYYEDFDFCRRYAAEGHPIAITSQIEIVHQASSITSRNAYGKSKHSTFSYLLTLKKYTNQFILQLRLFRVLLHAIVLLPLKPQKALGTLDGIWQFLKRMDEF